MAALERAAPRVSVRVTWAASLATMFSPKNGIAWSDATKTTPKLHGDRITDYAQSKASNVLLSREYAARHGKDSGIVSNSWNPGNLASELQRHSTAVEKFVTQFLVYKPVFGAYTELFAGWSEEAGKPENDAAVRESLARWTKLPVAVVEQMKLPRNLATQMPASAITFWTQVAAEQGLTTKAPDASALIFH